ncbi:16S rRNA (guanine(966)-N(2))-methyltransferase RsmD [Psychrobacillus vulpis]|uniref:16S rRNA (Guanine(966)-N(2))-methyltransferase RsmD n=1 Tax=Psychrobacillus vulpis TaxID=2325572 RepID=A0A544TK51_9BACI|nr:16S rRNA (guanine(966)-N(2))-methyltransferase RsmD [Psychrobacillus vulpis]TQR17837.1 16S rRNA (guanine(966)-N(2))-methyltransferase RsmD [Psychrobacillus vulpis]
MRVISGSMKGLPLKAVPGTNTRPTTDKVKESIFNMIGPYFEGGVAVDLFAGSGNLGIEALSRGIDTCIFIEKDQKAMQTIGENLKKCRLEASSELYKIDASRAVKAFEKRSLQIDLLFVDPPYDKVLFYDFAKKIVEIGCMKDTGIIVCEHEKNVELASELGNFTLTRRETYGSTVISIYRKSIEEGN